MRAFAQVDVFTSVAGLGNPVAVVLDADGLDDAALARFATWTNLSETTFVLPATRPEADYRVRIFTPSSELPFAGHPTLGTCRALLDAGLVKPSAGRIVQECAAGLVPLELADDGTLTFTAPLADVIPAFGGAQELPAALGGVSPQGLTLVNAGPHWLVGRVSPAELDGLAPDAPALRALFAAHGWDLTLYAVEDDGTVHVRSFFDAGGLAEDPVCGSGNVAVAAQLRATGATDVPAAYQSRQGRYRGRDGRLSVHRGEQITVGGHAVTVITGTVTI
jgi:PhzF family phenazine biosynthesis protein